LVCAKHVAQNNSRSVNFYALVRCLRRITEKAAGLVSGGFFTIWLRIVWRNTPVAVA
jgi:hypothetical protein